jgi:hypothetical protein
MLLQGRVKSPSLSALIFVPANETLGGVGTVGRQARFVTWTPAAKAPVILAPAWKVIDVDRSLETKSAIHGKDMGTAARRKGM